MTEQKLRLSWKYKDYEIRTCSKRLTSLDDNAEGDETCELIKWKTNSDGEPYCFTIAYWCEHYETGYELKFVGDNPFEYITAEDLNVVWQVLEGVQDILNGWFDLKKVIEV